MNQLPTQANSIKEVIDQLDKIINNSIKNSNRNGYFAALYKKVTVAISEKIQERYFDNNERMEKLDVVFANRYLTAWQQYQQQQPVSASWLLAFQTAQTWKPMVIDHLIAGMNAHIGLDLGIATATVAPGNQLDSIQADFNKINEILNGLAVEVKKDLFSIWPLSKWLAGKDIDKIENTAAGFSMSVARDAAWKMAIEYASSGSDEKKKTSLEARDLQVAQFGHKLLHPGWFGNFLHIVARIFEQGSIPEKIKKLNT